MRLGGPVFNTNSPEEWVEAHKIVGYSAAYWPNVPVNDEEKYLRAAADADLLIAEVGAWSNPLSPNEETRQKAVNWCINQLATAERVGARCCVNIAGSLGEKWDGPFAADLTTEAFNKIVETTQYIIDAVNPKTTFYTLETMPWMYPDSVDSYLALKKAINREHFAVHLDPVNLINCPSRYFNNGTLIKETVAQLYPWIRSCHGKDIILRTNLTVHLDEIVPGQGGLDYRTYLHSLDNLDKDTPLMLEHMNEPDYPIAAAYIRKIASEENIKIK